MKRSIFLGAVLGGALALAGCAHTGIGPTLPDNLTGRAATTSSGIDSMGNTAPGVTAGPNVLMAADPGEPPGIDTGVGPDRIVLVNPGGRGVGPGDPIPMGPTNPLRPQTGTTGPDGVSGY